MEGKGFFTKELQLALANHEIDLIVHSLKDLPTEEPEGLTLRATLSREDPADLLLVQSQVRIEDSTSPLSLPPGSVLGTSSLRRAAQALTANPQLEISALRGNVPTRLAKLRDGAYDAILLAWAGVHRLDLDLRGLQAHKLPSTMMLPAPGQGALAIETREGDPLTHDLATLNDPEVVRCVTAERRLLQLLGGGCHLPLGCHATPMGDQVSLAAALGKVDDDVREATVARVSGTAPTPEKAAQDCYQQLTRHHPELVA